MDWVQCLLVCLGVYVITVWCLRKLTIGDFQQRHVFITGCDTGFGHQLAIRLDQMGFRVFAGCLTEKGECELRTKASSRLVTVHLDVASEISIKEARDFVQKSLPARKGLWGLVNNAGVVGRVGPAEWVSRQEYLRTLGVNLFGLMDTTRVFLSLLRLERGRVVNMSSANGSVTFPYFLPYTISKYGVEVFSDSLRPEARKYGVTVHIIKPGMFDTNIRRMEPIVEDMKRSFERLDPELQNFYGRDFLSAMIVKVLASPKASSNTAAVVNAYVHALTSRYPRKRYHVGVDANTVYRLLSWIPDSLTDFLYSRILPTPVGGATLER